MPRERYATLAELKTHLGITGTGDDTMLGIVLDAAEDAIDPHCGRVFTSVDTSVDGNKTTRSYTPRDAGAWAWIDDAAAVDTVETRASPDEAYTAWDAADWGTWPANAAADNRPYEALVAINAKRFNTSFESLRVTAWFGWPAVPQPVHDATLIQANRLFRRSESPFGVSQTPEMEGGGGMRLLAKLDADVQVLLSHLQRSQLL